MGSRADIKFTDVDDIILSKVEKARILDVSRLRELRDKDKRQKNLEKELIKEKKQLHQARVRRLGTKNLDDVECKPDDASQLRRSQKRVNIQSG